MNELLKTQINLLPDKPGCYLMKDKDDKIIYVGKAKNLKKRVSQYFLRPQSGKVQAMVSHVDHFETIVLHSEKEALILEINLIQTHYPRYNIALMDDSHYPYIGLKRKGDLFLKILRNTKDNSYYHFGPFPNASSAWQTLDLLNRLFPTRKCQTLKKKSCLYYSLGQCLAPCEKDISPEIYDDLYQKIKSFLNGDVTDVTTRLKEDMKRYSESLNFEAAAECKKTLDSIEQTISKQHVEIHGDLTSRDAIAYYSREGYICLAILSYRKGRLLGKKTYVVQSFGDEEEQVIELVEQFYSTHEAPKEISSRIKSLKEQLDSTFPEISVSYPKEGRLVETISLAALNAKEALDAHFASARLNDDNLKLLEELGSLIHIKTPYRIELFDNSHLQGSSPVGAMVCFINGERAKKMYRKFHLKEEDAGDDYHSMKEVITRRYSRLKEENAANPDLILVDGGLTQVRAAKDSLDSINVNIPLIGLFKNDKHETEGLIDVDGNVYPLDKKSPLFFLLMRMQDEVHRFAITFHKELRNKTMTKGVLDDIPGLGEKRKELINMHYSSIDELKNASIEELSQIVPGDIAEKIYSKFH